MEKALYKITHGLYIVTTEGGGCIVDAVSQISGGEKPLLSISVQKKNYTNELLKKNKKLVLSVLGKKSDKSYIQTFGYQSSRDTDKFKDIEYITSSMIKIPKTVMAYITLSVEDTIENETHTVFICRYESGDILDEEDEELTYNYYQKHKEEFQKVETTEGKTAWVCTVCGYVVYQEELPDDFTCPVCGVDKSLFEKK